MTVLDLPRWSADVERGPDWLFLRLHAPAHRAAEGEDLADMVWHAMEQHFAKRVVLELELVPLLHSRLIGQLVLLQKRIVNAGGTLRICGLNPANEAALYATRLSKQLPCYHNRSDAVMAAARPNQPR